MFSGMWEPKRYLINQKWWTQWCDFVNFDSKTSLDNSCDINLLPKKQAKPAKYDRAVLQEGEPYNSRGWFDSQQSELAEGLSADSAAFDEVTPQLYERPARICNVDLLERHVPKGMRQRLKANLIEHFDFTSLYPSVWKHLYSWYSADVQIVRSFKKDVLNRHVMILDLYPDAEARQFTGYEYASGCQNLNSERTSTHNSLSVNRHDEVQGQRSRPDKPSFNLSELKRAQQEFMQKGADSPREMTNATNTLRQTAAFVRSSLNGGL